MSEKNTSVYQKKRKRSAFNLLIQIDPKSDRCKIVDNDFTGIPERVQPLKHSQFLSRLLDGRIHPDDCEEYRRFWQGEAMQRLLSEDGYASFLAHEFRFKLRDGSWAWREEMVLPVRQDDEDVSLFCFIRDIQEETRNTEMEMARILLPDSKEFFRKAALYLEDHSDERHAVIAIDIRNFRLYNELFGRKKGNERLETIDQCIRERLIPEGRGVAGYFGGDNFCLVHTFTSEVDFKDYVRGMYNSIISEYSSVRGFAVMIGACEVSDSRANIHYMVDCARSAVDDIRNDMTRAVGFYNEEKHGKQLADQQLIMNAMDGIRDGEFTFCLQPQCELETGKIIGVEALARWMHDGETITPATFVPVLEKYGYVTVLDQYIWEEVIKWQKSLLDRGIDPPPCSVNISRGDFYYMDVAKVFSDLLDKYSLPPELIKIEITESVYSEDLKQVVMQATRMKKRGLSIMLDDFGTGYSSLDILNEMKFDLIKADMKFMHMGREGYDLFGFILNTANMVGVPVVSEGVETLENVEELKKRGCELAQGYFYYKPLQIKEYEHLLMHPEEQVRV